MQITPHRLNWTELSSLIKMSWPIKIISPCKIILFSLYLCGFPIRILQPDWAKTRPTWSHMTWPDLTKHDKCWQGRTHNVKIGNSILHWLQTFTVNTVFPSLIRYFQNAVFFFVNNVFSSQNIIFSFVIFRNFHLRK